MPMIDVYAAKGTFADKKALLQQLNDCIMKWEKVPPIPMFKDNTASYLHELNGDDFANASGANDYIRIQVLTPAGTLDRDQKLGVTKDMTDIVVAASGGSAAQVDKTWVQIVEAPDGGWGMSGHAYTRAEIAVEARKKLGLPPL